MKLSKKDIKLIGEFIDSKNPKLELNYALVGRGGIFATDSRKAIKFHTPMLHCDEILVHKKLLKGFEGSMGKDDMAELAISSDSVHLQCNYISLNLDTASFEFLYPDVEKIIGMKLPEHFSLNSLDDIMFELTQRYCFVDFNRLYPLIAHGDADKYDVFYKAQSVEDTGTVKIVATRTIDEEDVIVYTAVIMGREFTSKAKEF